MKVCITEKPSVARDIASILGADRRCDGFFEGNGFQVTWTYGHLCTLKEPSDYNDGWKRWSLGTLPMIPPKFGIKLIGQESIKKQFAVIKSLIKEADEIINCGDAGQEGELIQRWVMQKAGVKCPVKRLWISSLTDASIKEGFNNLRDAKEFDNLYYAGLSRAIGDWLLGLNATRLYSLRYSSPGNTLSVGRVQTPTLALIVKRQQEIENFKPEDYWELKTTYRDVVFTGEHRRIKSLEEATRIVDSIKNVEFIITDIEEKKGTEFSPRLFDLTSLQVECNRKWGWSADETLKLIQSLYEKKLTTYPRVDTTYLSSDLKAGVPDILGKMKHYAALIEPVLKEKISTPKRIFDDSKVTDHHAIIPTGESPSILSDSKERQLYHLIALRFIANFYPDCKFLSTIVMGEAGKEKFKASGKIIIQPGWRDVLLSQKDKDEDSESDSPILPSFVKGERGPHQPFAQKKTTQPPKYYTEGTLLRAMETAGKTVEENELREALKENGIGRPSTRAAIIETLFKRGYIIRQRKNIIATPAGIQLINTINQELLKSAKLTGIWENRLRLIERGNYSASEFIEELKAQLNEIVRDVLNDSAGTKIDIQKNEDKEPPKKTRKKKS